MTTALIGHSGFVGSSLLAKRSYDSLFRSSDIDTIRGKSFDHLVCAGVQAMKWWANLHPEEDQAGIDRLLGPLAEVRAERFTLISTIDVYLTPRGVDEDAVVERAGHHNYGLHRLQLEDWVRRQFPQVLILRLPGLFGPGIKKNVIFDLLHDNGLDKVHPGGVFQYYDLRRLADDIDRAWELGIDRLNLSTGQLATSEIRDRFFPCKELGGSGPAPASYDMKSKHAEAWGGADGYLYSKEQVIADLGDWLGTVGLGSLAPPTSTSPAGG
jgi:nucleoside-diphosphate-sugar epimerase